MKKFGIFALAVVLIMTLTAACDSGVTPSGNPPVQSPSQQTTPPAPQEEDKIEKESEHGETIGEDEFVLPLGWEWIWPDLTPDFLFEEDRWTTDLTYHLRNVDVADEVRRQYVGFEMLLMSTAHMGDGDIHSLAEFGFKQMCCGIMDCFLRDTLSDNAVMSTANHGDWIFPNIYDAFLRAGGYEAEFCAYNFGGEKISAHARRMHELQALHFPHAWAPPL